MQTITREDFFNLRRRKQKSTQILIERIRDLPSLGVKNLYLNLHSPTFCET